MYVCMDRFGDVSENLGRYQQLFQVYLDKSVPRIKERWVGLAGLLFVFLLRVVLAQGWYVVCYALAIYLLNLFLAFLSPKFDPQMEQDIRNEEAEEGGPGGGGDEFRPFIRRLSEFDFWYRATIATLISIACSVSRVTDLPVFWPILVVYFFVLFFLTMRRQIQHMIEYRYLPFDIGKKKFGSQK